MPLKLVVTPVGSVSDEAYAVALQADGKILVAGGSAQGASGIDFALLRYTANGALDTTFGNGGKVTTPFGNDTDRAYAIVVQGDGRIVVYQVTRVVPGDPKEASAERRKQLQAQLGQVMALEAMDAIVKDLRRKMRIEVAEDRM